MVLLGNPSSLVKGLETCRPERSPQRKGAFGVGIGTRVFLVDDNDSPQRLSVARLDRLLRFDRGETLPQYAGKRIRCAMAMLEVAGKQILAIRHIDYFMLPFDGKGRIDKKEWTRRVRLALELLPSVPEGMHPKQVIDARHRFMKRRYDHEFKWKPSRQLEEGIVATILRSAQGQV